MVKKKSTLVPGPQSRGPFYARKRYNKIEVVSEADEKVIAVVVSPAGYANGDALQIVEALNALRKEK
jgi:endonuclease III